jgi:hypothetical protein
MPSSSNVSAGKPKVTGAIFIAPVGTTLPTDSTTALNSAFVELGYASDAGVVNSESRETETIKAWGGDTVLKPFTGKEDTFQFTLIEALNVNALKLVYGDSNVTGDLTNGISIKSAAEDLDYHSFVIEMVLNGAVKRIVIPSAKVTEVGDITYADGEAIGYDTTLSAVPDAAGGTHYEYIKAVSNSGTTTTSTSTT